MTTAKQTAQKTKEQMLNEAMEIAKASPQTEKTYYLSLRVLTLKSHLQNHPKDKANLFGLIKLNKRLQRECNYLIQKGLMTQATSLAAYI